MKQRSRTLLMVLITLGLATVGVLLSLRHRDWWITDNQLGDYYSRRHDYQNAAKVYDDPLRQGTALFRAGQFKEAAGAFLRVAGPEGAYNRGNALLMAGKYRDAVTSYRKALEQRPDWKEAQDNLAVALVRQKRLEAKGGDESGGEMKADEIVFDKNKNPDAKQTTEIAGGEPLSDSDLRGLWLRQVQTKPADFLRAKFAYQLQQQKKEPQK